MCQISTGPSQNLNVHKPIRCIRLLELIEVVGLFNSMSRALDVKERTTSVNSKITYAAEVSFSFTLITYRHIHVSLGSIRPAPATY
jgi:hypothetical protein